ncbi:MAG TPA: hydroxyectoine utilization dehydratase EutB [Desulfosporosinus sp.]|nr:hydroxyectoine utilization dehydratase EutB [Desulfosporosinus sp.]
MESLEQSKGEEELWRQLPSIRDIWSARERISSMVIKTPLIISPVISEQVRASVFLKLENLHETGAFKIRGAANKMLSLTLDEQKRGVATFSTGNHGLAVAYVAKKLGIPAVVCISNRVPSVKVDALRRMGTSVQIHGNSQDEAEEYCHRFSEQHDLTVIRAFDDPFVISGQGTIGLELLEDFPAIDTVIVPLSGGGLLSGIALVMKSIDPRIRVIGVSMERGAVMYQSLRAGRPVELPEEDTLADSLLGGIGLDNRYTFRMVQNYVDETVLVTEEAIAEGMAYLMKSHRMVVEGAAATGIAAVLQSGLIAPGSNVAVIVSGNNVDVSSFLKATERYL